MSTIENPTTELATETPAAATRATWKQHGNPIAGFVFYGTEVKTAAAQGKVVAKVVTDQQGVHLKGTNGRAIKGGDFAAATKFWAIVPDSAERRSTTPTEPKPKAEKLAPVKITAPKGGDQTVAPIKGAIAKAIAKTGESIMAISRKHGLNPSQMRRLSLDTVAKVDLVRAEQIATALGVKLADLFGEPTDKAKVKPASSPATDKLVEQAEAGAAAKAEGDQGDQGDQAEADAAAKAAEGSQDEPTTDPAA